MIWQSIYIMGNLNWSDYTRILTTLSRLENLVMVKMLNLRGTIINDNGSIAQLTMLDAKTVRIDDCKIGDSAGNGRIENHIIRRDNIFIDNSEIYMLFVNVAIRSYCISFPVDWQGSLRSKPQVGYKILQESPQYFR